MRFRIEELRPQGFLRISFGMQQDSFLCILERIINMMVCHNLAVEDKWILSKLNTLAKEVTDNLDKFELGIAIEAL